MIEFSVICYGQRSFLHDWHETGPKVIKRFSCSTQLSMKF